MDCNLQPQTDRVVFFVVMGQVDPDAPVRNAVLTDYGASCISRASEMYEHEVWGALTEKYGPSTYHCAALTGAVITTWLLDNMSGLAIEESLRPALMFSEVQGGQYLLNARQRTHQWLVRNLPPDTASSDMVHRDRTNLLSFILGPGAAFRIAVVTEPMLSLGLSGILPEDEMGVEPCQAVLVQMSGSEIIRAEKVVARCTFL